LIRVDAQEARDGGDDKEDGNRKGWSAVPYYAAGTGVMSLVFSLAGAAGSMLEEEENGTLERFLTATSSINVLLTGRWFFYTIIGVCQLTLLFVWGATDYGLDLWTVNHLVGIFAMTIPTAAAAAAFGIMFASACRTRAQLNGISTIVILVMSAFGGSMIPRDFMSESMQTVSKLTFNGWAMDGYRLVFWYDDPDATLLESLATLVPSISVIIGLTVLFVTISRLLARRWASV